MPPSDTLDPVTDPDTVDTLNALLRGELSAAESYEQAVGTFSDLPAVADTLREIRDDHREAVRAIRDHVVTEYHGDPSEKSGPWGGFVALVTGTAKALGSGALLAALRQGEDLGIQEYRRALESGIPPVCRDLILNQLIPRCEEHIAELDDLTARLG